MPKASRSTIYVTSYAGPSLVGDFIYGIYARWNNRCLSVEDSSALGLIAGEWKSAPSIAQIRMRAGLALIIVCMSVLGISTLVC